MCVCVCVYVCMQGMVIENMLSALYLNSDGTQKHMKHKSKIHSERKWMNIRRMAQRTAFVIEEETRVVDHRGRARQLRNVAWLVFIGWVI